MGSLRSYFQSTLKDLSGPFQSPSTCIHLSFFWIVGIKGYFLLFSLKCPDSESWIRGHLEFSRIFKERRMWMRVENIIWRIFLITLQALRSCNVDILKVFFLKLLRGIIVMFIFNGFFLFSLRSFFEDTLKDLSWIFLVSLRPYFENTLRHLSRFFQSLRTSILSRIILSFFKVLVRGHFMEFFWASPG